jgi:hypothetical protein
MSKQAYQEGVKAGYDKTIPRTPNPYEDVDPVAYNAWEEGYCRGSDAMMADDPMPDLSGQYDASPEPLPDTVDPISGEPIVKPALLRLIDVMPGLIGGIDMAINDQVGKPMPFVLVVFEGNTAAHATNFDAGLAMDALKNFTDSLAKQGD